jgi:hypothetical protein
MTQAAANSAGSSPPGFLARLANHRVVAALGGALLGGVVGMGVSWAWDAATGATSLDDVVAQQKQSFASIEASLAQLQGSTSPELLSSIAGDLRREMGTQQRIAARLQSELANSARELGALRKQLLASQDGYPGGAEFWLGAGDSIRLAGDGNAFAVGQAWSIYADVTIDGAPQRIQVGAQLPFSADGRECKVIFRQAARAEDQRAGFDVSCPAAVAAAS